MCDLLQPCSNFILREGQVFRNLTQLACYSSKNLFASPHSLVEDTDANKTALVDLGIYGAGCNQVIDGNRFAFLPIAVEAPNTLFNAHRIPGQVIVYQAITKLVIETFTSYLGVKQHIECFIIFPGPAKAITERTSILFRGASVNQSHSNVFSL